MVSGRAPIGSKHHYPRKTKAQLVEEIERLERRLDAVESVRAHENVNTDATAPVTLDLWHIYKETQPGFCYFDTKLRFLQINDWLANINGMTVDEHLGRTIDQVLPDVAAGVESQLRQVIQTGKPIIGGRVEAETLAQPGVKRTFQHNYYPVRSDDGTVVGISCIVEDVTEHKRTEDALRRSEASLANAQRVTNLGNWEMEIETGRATWSDELYRIFGYQPGEIEPSFDLVKATVYPADRDAFVEIHRSAREEGLDSYEHEYRIVRRDGAQRFIHSQAEIERDEAGEPVRFFGTIHDITERKQAEEALQEAHDKLESRIEEQTKELRDAIRRLEGESVEREEATKALAKSEQKYRNVLESTNAVPWEADAKTWMFSYIGPQADKLLSYPRELWLEEGFWADHIHPEDRAGAIDYCLKSANHTDDFEFEYRMIAEDGRSVWIHDIVNVVRNNGEPEFLQGFMIDITERKQAEESIRNLSARLISAHEEERSRIARDLHDGLGQNLALLCVDLELERDQMQNSQDSRADRINALLERTKEISSAVHKISHQLHPTILEYTGLPAAARTYCKDVASQHAIEIEFAEQGVSRSLPSDVALCAYRIIQEALRNVVKHSGARTARVKLVRTTKELLLQISDTGKGFDPESRREVAGLGLLSMRERLRLVGGKLSISCLEPNGTLIDVRVPIPDPDDLRLDSVS